MSASFGSLRTHGTSASRLPKAAFLIVGLAILFAQTSGQAAPGDALPYAKGYSGPINYVVGSVDLTEQANPIDQFGFSTGTLSISGVPKDADIVAAYLYWETITLKADPSQAAGASFRGHELLLNDIVAVKKSSQDLVGSAATCWSSGVPLQMTLFRADVLPLLPVRVDKDGRSTGKRIVNDVDLVAHGLDVHKVKLPMRTGNQLPESAGASLVIVYNDQSEPFRKVLFYDGIFIQKDLTTPMVQTLRGFYKSAKTVEKSAKITHILGSGQPNANERIFFNDKNPDPITNVLPMTQISPIDPIAGGSSSQRGWNALTYDVTNLMNPGANSSGGYGETATTKLDHAPGGGYDCLAWGAVVFAPEMADADGDGEPDGAEDAAGGLKDPDDTQLPDLKAMGAGSGHRDLFLEVNGMWAPGANSTTQFAGTTYGSVNAPYPNTAASCYNATTKSCTDAVGHQHLPTPEDIKRIGDRYKAHGITLHVDVGCLKVADVGVVPGCVSAYHGLGVVQHGDWVDDYTSTAADEYLIGSGTPETNVASLARGGEVIEERACDPTNPSCQFPAYPGTVGWKFGLQLFRDAPVADDGTELDLANKAVANLWENGDPNAMPPKVPQHRRRFDRARFGLFHYVLYAHARGTPKLQPCLAFGDPAPYSFSNGTSCTDPNNPNDTNHTANPDFAAHPEQYHVPTSASGVADLPGGNVMVTLGLWDEFVGKPFTRAATTFHEVGHNLNLWHGGTPAVWGNDVATAPAVPTANYIEPNCKTNYPSSMSYLYQVHGLFDSNDFINLDYAGTPASPATDPPLVFPSIFEATLSDGTIVSAPVYRFAWYAPASSALALSLQAPEAKRYCSGRTFPSGTNPHMARVYTTATAPAIDWDGSATTSSASQDVNLDGVSGSELKGFDDWSNIKLYQIAAGRKLKKFEAEYTDAAIAADPSLAGHFGDTIDFGSGDTVDFGSGDTIDFGSGDTVDFGSGDTVDFGSGVFYDLQSGDTVDFGSGDTVDFGSGDTVDFGSGDTVDFGSGDTVDFGSGSERQEVDYNAARELGRGNPSGLTVCALGTTNCNINPPITSSSKLWHHSLLRWSAVPVGKVTEYRIQRKKAGAADSTYTQIGTSTTSSFIDPDNLSDTGSYTYRVRARFDDVSAAQLSGWSQPVTRGPVK